MRPRKTETTGSGLSHWRRRIGDGLDALLAESPRVAHDIGASSTKFRFFHFITVFGLRSYRPLSSLIEACDRRIAALIACVVLALPCSNLSHSFSHDDRSV